MLFTKTLATTGTITSLGENVNHELHTHKSKYIFQGVVFITAGMLAAIFPAITALNIELIVGAIILVTGIFQLFMTLKSHIHMWSMVSALLSIGIGVLILSKPLPILLAFVTLLAIFMTLEGILELALSFQFRPARNWAWMFFSGIITLVLALMLWIGFPYFDVFYLGWVIAINLILYGISLLMLVWKASP